MTDETSEHDSDASFDADLAADFGTDFAADLAADFGDDELDDELDDVADLDPQHSDALADAERAMVEARSRLSEVPAEVVITNHVMGLYELAAIHLSATPPDLRQAALAIDAVACLVDGLDARLGEEAPTMRDALNNIRIAFVQIKGRSETTADVND